MRNDFGREGTYAHASYAAFRPVYPTSLYNAIYAYHKGLKTICLDLGCGPGTVSRHIAKEFDRVIGIDPSEGMITQAQNLCPPSEFPSIRFKQAPAEHLPFVADNSVDAVFVGQAVHWFDHEKFFAEMCRILREDGTLAFWGYADHVLVDYPRATAVLHRHCLDRGGGGSNDDPDRLGYYWERPGRKLVENYLRDIVPPKEAWKETKRLEYEPSLNGSRIAKGELFLHRKMTICNCKEYMRTWSAYHKWMEAHPGRLKRSDAGEGDVIDLIFDEMASAEGWDATKMESFEVDVEWGTAVVMTRRK